MGIMKRPSIVEEFKEVSCKAEKIVLIDKIILHDCWYIKTELSIYVMCVTELDENTVGGAKRNIKFYDIPHTSIVRIDLDGKDMNNREAIVFLVKTMLIQNTERDREGKKIMQEVQLDQGIDNLFQ